MQNFLLKIVIKQTKVHTCHASLSLFLTVLIHGPLLGYPKKLAYWCLLLSQQIGIFDCYPLSLPCYSFPTNSMQYNREKSTSFMNLKQVSSSRIIKSTERVVQKINISILVQSTGKLCMLFMITTQINTSLLNFS